MKRCANAGTVGALGEGMKTNDSSKGKIVIGHGTPRSWADNASAVERADTDLLARAHATRIFDLAQRDGYATRDGELLQDAWLLVVGDVADSDLDYDPAVIAYCDAP